MSASWSRICGGGACCRNYGFWLSSDGRCTQYPPQPPPALGHYFPLTRCRIESRPVGRRFYYRLAVILRRAHLPSSVRLAARGEDVTADSDTAVRRRRTFGVLVLVFHCRSHKMTTEQTVDVTTTMRRVREHVTLYETTVKCSSRTAVSSLLLLSVHDASDNGDASPRTWRGWPQRRLSVWILRYFSLHSDRRLTSSSHSTTAISCGMRHINAVLILWVLALRLCL